MTKRRTRIDLDDDLIRRVREADGRTGLTDTDVIESALAVHLGIAALSQAQDRGGLDDEAANRLAVEEVRAVRGSALRRDRRPS